MGSKLNPGEFDCYSNALPDEPMFILLARDPHAPALVQLWATYRGRDIEVGDRPKTDQAMVEEAIICATSMRGWRIRNDGKWRLPPSAAPAPQDDSDMPHRIWLSPDCGKGDCHVERSWCSENQWQRGCDECGAPAIEYVVATASGDTTVDNSIRRDEIHAAGGEVSSRDMVVGGAEARTLVSEWLAWHDGATGPDAIASIEKRIAAAITAAVQAVEQDYWALLDWAKNMRLQPHVSHWDRTGGSGSGCPACIVERAQYARLQIIIDAIRARTGRTGE